MGRQSSLGDELYDANFASQNFSRFVCSLLRYSRCRFVQITVAASIVTMFCGSARRIRRISRKNSLTQRFATRQSLSNQASESMLVDDNERFAW